MGGHLQVLATALSRDAVQRCLVDAKAALMQQEDLVPRLLMLLAELPPLTQTPPAADGTPATLPVRDPSSCLPAAHGGAPSPRCPSRGPPGSAPPPPGSLRSLPVPEYVSQCLRDP